MSEEKKSEEEVIKTGYKIGYGLIYLGLGGVLIATLVLFLLKSPDLNDVLRIVVAQVLSLLVSLLGWKIVIWLKQREY
jgi:hypothetical protein